MLAKLPMASIFLCYSMLTMSAGITIDVDLDMTLDAISYPGESEKGSPSDPSNTPSVPEGIDCTQAVLTESQSYNNSSALLAEIGLKVTHDFVAFPGEDSSTAQHLGNDNWSVWDNFSQSSYRNWDSHCDNGNRPVTPTWVGEGVIPELKDMYFFTGSQTLFVLDEHNILYQGYDFFEEDGDWISDLPSGAILWVREAGSSVYVGIDLGTRKEVRKLGANSSLIRSVDSSGSQSLNHYHYGHALVSKSSSEINVDWLNSDRQSVSFSRGISSGYFYFPYDSADIFGRYGTEGIELFWSDDNKVVSIDKPEEGLELSECFGYKKELFCVEPKQDGMFDIWKLQPPFISLSPTLVWDSRYTVQEDWVEHELKAFIPVNNNRILIVEKSSDENVIEQEILLVKSDLSTQSIKENILPDESGSLLKVHNYEHDLYLRVSRKNGDDLEVMKVALNNGYLPLSKPVAPKEADQDENTDSTQGQEDPIDESKESSTADSSSSDSEDAGSLFFLLSALLLLVRSRRNIL